MKKELQFVRFAELVKLVCARPGMFTPKGSYNEIISFLAGCSNAARSTPLSGNNWRIFGRFVCLKFGISTNVVWWAVLKWRSTNEEEAIALTEATILDFLDKRKNMSAAKVLEYAAKWAVVSDGLPEKIFKEVRDALLYGKEEVLKKHLLPHNDQHLLWEKAYLRTTPRMQATIYNNLPIKRIHESADGNTVKLMVADFLFPIEMSLQGGDWKIDATGIIRAKKEEIAEQKQCAES